MIALVGFMGAGKTSVGRLVATRLGLPFVDTDALIEARAGKTVERIFAEDGEAAFREVESRVVAEVLDGPEAVVALGGGALGDPATCTALEWATVVHLDLTFAEVLRRVGDGETRPLMRGDPKALYSERRATYQRVADVTVATDGLSPEAVAAEVVALVGGGRGALGDDARRVVVPIPGRSYEVAVGPGLSARAGELVPAMPDAERLFVVTHPSLEALAAPFVESMKARDLQVDVVHVPEGEESKSLAVAHSLYEELAVAGAHRHDVVAAFGGGVIGDLAGYVASTFNRGMPIVHVPTTLLGQVDAAIGGKTGVNLAHGKNLVGTFHQPIAVICDVELLGGLPEPELVSGMAEVVKYGFIADPGILDIVETRWDDIAARASDALTEIVVRSAAVKAGIVAADERERGERAYLNYGHTLAHAIETVAGFGHIRHGEAVSLGMMAAAHLARLLDRIDDALVDRHRRVLARVGLPVSAVLDHDALADAWRHDKKYRRGTRFVLLNGLGRPEAGVEAPDDLVGRAVERLAT